MLKYKRFCRDDLADFVNNNGISRSDIVAINYEYDGQLCLWYWEWNKQDMLRAVAQVCLKPGDPLDPNGTFQGS